MKLKKIISFNGDHGSGKSTIAKKLSEELDYERFYMGKIFRDMAREKNISYAEFLNLLKKDTSYDNKVDNYVIELGKNKDNFIIESRTAWHFIPNSFKIYLQVSELEGAKRMFADYQAQGQGRDVEGDSTKSIDDIIQLSKNRKKEDDKRYRKLYNIDVNNMDNYDLVLDTTNLNREEVFQKIIDAVNKYINTVVSNAKQNN